MPYFKVLGGNWGEGHQPGDVIELDDNAAEARLAAGDIEPAKAKAKAAEPKKTKAKK